ncbi:uncharacterized protein LOC122452313 [Cervus canadensis]|uniref:uncharacterized protein LOC122452313 n=1 Tax=Cervus canadensis TaxID=1574408 RepID=UPI001C9E5EB4|nr:uncharacterized protein LOC122452313 [Cervus canadensis]
MCQMLTYSQNNPMSYFLRGKPIIVCNLIGENVSWSDTIPHCEKIYCGQPPKIKHGKHTNSYRNIFEYNELITYSCDLSNGPDEYSLVGQSKLVCIEPNKWSSDPPLCKVVKCERPFLEHGIMVSGSREKFSYQSVVVFECLQGFYLNGSNLVFCGGNDTWEPEMPTCIKGYRPTHPTKTPLSQYPGYPNPVEEIPSLEDFEDLDAGIIALAILTAIVAVIVVCTCLYRCLFSGKKEEKDMKEKAKEIKEKEEREMREKEERKEKERKEKEEKEKEEKKEERKEKEMKEKEKEKKEKEKEKKEKEEVTARGHCLQTRKLVLPRHHLRQGLDLGVLRFQTARKKSAVYRLPCLECLSEPPGAPMTNTRFAVLCESSHRKAKTEGLSPLIAQRHNLRNLQVRIVGVGPENHHSNGPSGDCDGKVGGITLEQTQSRAFLCSRKTLKLPPECKHTSLLGTPIKLYTSFSKRGVANILHEDLPGPRFSAVFLL